MITIKDLHAHVDTDDGDVEILKGISLEIPEGEVHAIMGPNGSGKSTLSYVLAGREDYEVTDGSIELNGEDLLELEPEERAAAGLFILVQDSTLQTSRISWLVMLSGLIGKRGRKIVT